MNKKKSAVKSKSVSYRPKKMSVASMVASKCDFPGCKGVHIPNKETERVLRETEAGINLESHESLDSFWKSMEN